MFETTDPSTSSSSSWQSHCLCSHAVPIDGGVDDAKSVFLDTHSLSHTHNSLTHAMDACSLPPDPTAATGLLQSSHRPARAAGWGMVEVLAGDNNAGEPHAMTNDGGWARRRGWTAALLSAVVGCPSPPRGVQFVGSVREVRIPDAACRSA